MKPLITNNIYGNAVIEYDLERIADSAESKAVGNFNLFPNMKKHYKLEYNQFKSKKLDKQQTIWRKVERKFKSIS